MPVDAATAPRGRRSQPRGRLAPHDARGYISPRASILVCASDHTAHGKSHVEEEKAVEGATSEKNIVEKGQEIPRELPSPTLHHVPFPYPELLHQHAQPHQHRGWQPLTKILLITITMVTVHSNVARTSARRFGRRRVLAGRRSTRCLCSCQVWRRRTRTRWATPRSCPNHRRPLLHVVLTQLAPSL